MSDKTKVILVATLVLILVGVGFCREPFDEAILRIRNIGDALIAVIDEKNAYAEALEDVARVGNPEVNAVITRHLKKLEKAEKKSSLALEKVNGAKHD